MPSLRFHLLPELREQTAGNGAVLYRKAGELLDKTPAVASERAGLIGVMGDWEKLPLAELPREEMSKALALYKEPLDLLHRAARSDHCDFEIAQRLREKGIGTLLPEVDQMRTAGLILRTRARLELLEDRPDQALRTLHTQYALARHIGEAPVLIATLVGVAMTTQANRVLEQVLSHPRTPNLTWSLVALPRPYFNLGRVFEGERLMGSSGLFPELLPVVNDLEAGPLTQEKIEKMTRNLSLLDGGTGLKRIDRTVLAVQIRSRHEAAKKALIAAGRPAETIEKWPHIQVALMDSLLEYDQLFDELVKWQALPYWQATAHLGDLRRTVTSSRTRGPDSPAIPLAPLLVPAVEKVVLTRERLERHFAALRHIEALRLYAADHDGKLPQRLADIKGVPLPVCPLTGKDFEYRLEGDRAHLSAPPVPHAIGRNVEPLRYEITLRKGEVKP
jgi:hypothetical protein